MVLPEQNGRRFSLKFKILVWAWPMGLIVAITAIMLTTKAFNLFFGYFLISFLALWPYSYLIDKLFVSFGVNDWRDVRQEVESEIPKDTIHLVNIGDMVSQVAHEINTPMALIHSQATFIKKNLQSNDLDLEEIIARTEKIKKTVERVEKTIRGLRNLSRKSNGMVKEPAKVGEIIDDLLSIVEQKFKKSRVLFEIDVDREHLLLCDRIQISQVLLNLLVNAFDAVTDLDEKWIKLSLLAQSEFDVIMITDSGHGIKSELQNKGTGLGSVIASLVLTNHGGSLELDEYCKNTRFILKLPSLASETNLRQKKIPNVS